jgi:hypothetical protein
MLLSWLSGAADGVSATLAAGMYCRCFTQFDATTTHERVEYHVQEPVLESGALVLSDRGVCWYVRCDGVCRWTPRARRATRYSRAVVQLHRNVAHAHQPTARFSLFSSAASTSSTR